MRRPPNRTTADLSAYPDLVVLYLGIRVNSPKGVKTLTSFGAKIRKSVEAQPDGLLLHENLLFSLFPPHAGMRQYWRDFDSLERWARSLPHQRWWQQPRQPYMGAQWSFCDVHQHAGWFLAALYDARGRPGESSATR